MPAEGPEPGWYFDPDRDGTERYWNGTHWTEHRRALISVSPSPTLAPTASAADADFRSDDVDAKHEAISAASDPEPHSVAEANGDEPVDDPTAMSSDRSSAVMAASIGPPSRPEGQRHGKGQKIVGAQAPLTTSAKYSVGNRVRIVNRPRYEGRIGKVIGVGPPYVKLKMDDDGDVLVFGQANVEPLNEENPVAATEARPASKKAQPAVAKKSTVPKQVKTQKGSTQIPQEKPVPDPRPRQRGRASALPGSTEMTPSATVSAGGRKRPWWHDRTRAVTAAVVATLAIAAATIGLVIYNSQESRFNRCVSSAMKQYPDGPLGVAYMYCNQFVPDRGTH